MSRTCQRHVMFVITRLLNKLSYKAQVGQILLMFKFAKKPDQPGLSSSIRSKVMMERTKHMQIDQPPPPLSNGHHKIRQLRKFPSRNYFPLFLRLIIHITGLILKKSARDNDLHIGHRGFKSCSRCRRCVRPICWMQCLLHADSSVCGKKPLFGLCIQRLDYMSTKAYRHLFYPFCYDVSCLRRRRCCGVQGQAWNEHRRHFE